MSISEPPDTAVAGPHASEPESGPGPGVSEGALAPVPARAGLVLAVVCLCQLMVVLDISVVNVALPSIRADLGFSASGLQWVVNAYTLTFGGLLLLGGRLADLAGQRRAAVAGLGLFGLTSLLGGLAQNPSELIAARAAQGVSGAVLLPVSLTVITTTFTEGAARHRALAVWGAVAGAGSAVGVLLGGVLTEYLNWRWVLFVNVPIAAVAIPLAAACIGNLRTARRPRLDVAGAVLATAAMVLLVYGVVRTDTYSWGSARTLGTLGAAAVLAVAFVLVERRVAAPLVRLGILRSRSLSVACVVIFLVACGQFGAFYFASLYLQGVLAYSPLRTGLAFVPFALGVIAGTIVAARLMARVGPRPPLVGGLALGAVGMGWFGWVSPDGGFATDLLGPSLVTSVGLGLCMVTNTAAGTTGVAREEAGLASGLLNAARQCGGSIGLAVLVTVAATVTRHQADPASAAAVTTGYDRAFLIAGILIGIAALAAFTLLPSRPRDRAAADRPAGAPTRTSG
ncbi:MFS transporter [Pseudofrankia saprophytica]|uniref:MFS transporter n=1 Tax=Pseudofrankia saprophytica TaxID=298655 RepID=UPI000234DAB3|nr:MFS transporter [Pseudofrankia saprophytica]